MARARRKWTLEEDATLRRVVDEALREDRPLLWRELAKLVPGRSNKDCRRRWWNSLADDITKGPWGAAEDQRLIEAVRIHGPNWSRVAPAVMTRNPDQCSSHWSQVLDPDINFCDWTAREDEQLLHAVLTHGTNWSTIATTHVPKRNTLALKNRYSTLRLRHENGDKSKAAKAAKLAQSRSSSSKNTPKTESNDYRRSRESSNKSNKSEEDIDNDDDDEDDMDSGSPNGNESDDYGKSVVEPFQTHRKRASDSSLGNYAKIPNTTTTGIWPGSGVIQQGSPISPGHFESGSSPSLADNWTSEPTTYAAYEPLFPLDDSSLWSGQDFAGTTPDLCGLRTVSSYDTYDSDPMEVTPLSHSQSPFYPTLINSFPDASTSTGLHVKEEQEKFQTLETTCPIEDNMSANYRVSIEMMCTNAQLEAVMQSMAANGSCVTIKIDPKP